MMSLNEAGDSLYYACDVVAILYAVFYSFRPWYTTPQGRALFVKAWGNAMVLSMVVAFLLFGPYPYRDEVRVVGMAWFFVGITYLCLTLLLSPGAENYPPWSWLRRLRGEREKVSR